MSYKYGYQGSLDGCARACITDAPISSKQAIMISKFLRGKTVERAKRDLSGVIAQSVAVPMTRFTEGAGHKPGKIAAGKYPLKAAKTFMMLIESAAKNADEQGLSENLRIISLQAQRASNAPRQGRHRGRQRKVTHVEVVVKEESMKVVKKPKKTAKKAPEKKAESKPKKTDKKEAKTSKKSKPAKKSAKPAKEQPEKKEQQAKQSQASKTEKQPEKEEKKNGN